MIVVRKNAPGLSRDLFAEDDDEPGEIVELAPEAAGNPVGISEEGNVVVTVTLTLKDSTRVTETVEIGTDIAEEGTG